MLGEDKPKVYKAAIYIRLSRDDGRGLESNSVTNQRDLIHAYIKKKTDISVVSEKIDDGYSGVTFDRPALQALLDEVKKGIVNCIIVKDLSRFGRNYLETGKYIEQIFPFLDVRFIAINDNIDTASKNTQTDCILVPFKNLLNDSYSRDISTKVRSQLAIRQKKGDFVGAFPVYGYLRAKEDKHKLVVDEIASKTVKDIFSMRIAGYNNGFISDYLNHLGVPSPLEYKRLLQCNYETSFQLNPIGKWTSTAIDRILKNEVYTGVLLQGKETTVSYKSKKRIIKDKESWIRVENTHEEIISKEDFKLVQSVMLTDTRTSPKQEKVYLLSGVLECGGCGSSMVRKTVKIKGKSYSYYICSKNKEDKRECSSHRIRESVVEEALQNILQKHQSVFFEPIKERNQTEFCEKIQREKEKLEWQLDVQKQELRRYDRLKKSLYEDYTEGILSQEEYFEMKSYYETLWEDIKKSMEALGQKMKEFYAEFTCNELGKIDRWANQTMNPLDRAMLVLLVEKIIVYDRNKMRVVLRYKNESETSKTL